MMNNKKKSCTLWLCILIGLLATDLIVMLANRIFNFLSDDWVRTCGGCALCLIAAVSFTVVNIRKADQES
ncbi:MAG: hypothetical protein J6Q02_05540 [Lachnospiraceae bacterium]|nr:hypothetical protein [Lachnospiraceae bacterium]MBO7338955.1 hypothetical protein [Lachnospiraceae bacterium]MBP5733313.1 hypothetical protein [Lachnospiraceae bacterium]